MPAKRPEMIDCRRVELDGVRYVIVREPVFEALCRKAGVDGQAPEPSDQRLAAGLDLDRATLAEKLRRRRRACGLSQAELARRAGIRPETLNRIERGRTTPDFRTVRRLVVAMNAAEAQDAAAEISRHKDKEPDNGSGK
jgi:DNA-binding XRE family transcriptional regulator